MADVTVDTNRGTRRRRWRLFLLTGLLVLLVVYVSFDWWAARRIERVTARLEQRYGTLSEDSLRLAAVPAPENRARLVRAATALSVPSIEATRAFISEAAKSPTLPPIPAELRQFVEKNREAMRVAEGFAARERTNWEVEPDGSNTPGLLEIRLLSNVLFVNAMIDLEAGRPDDASKSIASGLAMAASLRHEQQVIAQLIRVAIGMHQVDAIQRLLAHAEPSAASLTELANRLAENRTPDPMRLGLLGELKHANATFARLERGRADATINSGRLFPVLTRVGRPLVRMARGSYLEKMEQLLQVQSGPRPKGPWPDMEGSLLSPWVGSLSGLARAVESGDDFASMHGAAEVAVALRRHRLDHGSYPADLAPLVPAYLAAIPIDPFTGKPPVYMQKDAGFTLQAQRYSAQPPGSRPAALWVISK